jgi:hypothetical protein
MVHDHIVVMATSEQVFGNGANDKFLYAGIKIRTSLHIEQEVLELLAASHDREQSVGFEILARSADETFVKVTIRAIHADETLHKLQERLAKAILPSNYGLDMETILTIEPLFPKPAETRPVVSA